MMTFLIGLPALIIAKLQLKMDVCRVGEEVGLRVALLVADGTDDKSAFLQFDLVQVGFRRFLSFFRFRPRFRFFVFFLLLFFVVVFLVDKVGEIVTYGKQNIRPKDTFAAFKNNLAHVILS